MSDIFSSSIFVYPRQYSFTPQDDITPLEAAWCAALFAVRPLAVEKFEKWDFIKRHFTEVTSGNG